MFLFIGESLGMWELVTIGVIALLIFGPRKLPQIARTIGKTMAEFRKATNDFRSTWEKEVDFEKLVEEEPVKTVAAGENTLRGSVGKEQMQVIAPEIRTLDEADFEKFTEKAANEPPEFAEAENEESFAGKRDWL